MKLRNKKTGEIIDIYKGEITLHYNQGRKTIHFKCLEDLEEWEEYEEPKKHYEILAMGAVMEREDAEDEIFRNQGQREIGNYFETKEEAEQAVEKLKAWKRLKEAGFRFAGGDGACISYRIDPVKWEDRLDNDFDLLFGGEE